MRPAKRAGVTADKTEMRRKALFDRVRKARVAMLLTSPFYGVLASSLRLTVDDTNPQTTAWTDGEQICFGLAWCESLSARQMTGLLVHEVLHVADMHHLRQGRRQADVWNKACDYVINGIAAKAGYVLPEGGLVDSTFDGMSAEQIYGILVRRPREDGGKTVPGEVRPPQAAKPHASGDQLKTLERQVRTLISRAAKAAKRAGKLPGDVELLVADGLRYRENWAAELLRFMDQHARADYCWQQPDPVFFGHNIVLPTLYSEEMGEIVVFVDTSGSMGPDDLVKAKDAVEQARLIARPSLVHVVSVDTAVRSVQRFEPGDDIAALAMRGGGGTNFVPAFEWVKQAGIEPVAVVYLTDGYGRFPESAPDYPVLWVINSSVQPPWGEHVRVN